MERTVLNGLKVKHSVFDTLLARFFAVALERTRGYDSFLIRRLYWNFRARDISETYGASTSDFEILLTVIASVNANRVLDLGCGSGRLFPLYERLGLHVVGQDISRNALNLAKARHSCENITLLNSRVENIDFPDKYFDLVISNRVLQHIPPNTIESSVASICRLARSVYVNELSDTDGIIQQRGYIFTHDYVRLFGNFGFKLRDSGRMDRQTWLLFSKTS